MTSLDDLLRQQANGDSTPSANALAAAKAELSKPRRSWRRDALQVVLTTALMACALTTVLLVTGNSAPELVLSRLPTAIPLLVLGAVGGWFAIAPGGTRARFGVLAASAVAMVGIVVARGAGHLSAQPEWVCTVSHLSLGVGPLVVAMFALRRSAPNVWRSVAAGLAIGTVGAVAGEVGCDQSWQHVMAFHLTPWLALTAAALLISQRMRRWSYAP